MIRRSRATALAVLTTAAVAALPAVAEAHPSVFFVTPKKTTDAGATLTNDVVQYAIAQHGYTRVLKETNGLTDHGILDYKYLPSAFRTFAGRTKTQILATGDTGAQPHATCQGLAQLGEAQILAWQGADPFYNYVPWQKTASGLDDAAEVSTWIDVVKVATGVDLAALDAAAAKTACQTLGGTFYDADTTQTPGSSFASKDISTATDPLNLQITSLGEQITSLTTLAEQRRVALEEAQAKLVAQTAAAQRSLAEAQSVRDANAAPLKVVVTSTDLSAGAIAKAGLGVKVTGVAGDPVTVTLKVSTSRAAKHGLPSRTIGTASVRLDASGSATVAVKLTKSAAAKLAALKGTLPLEISAQLATVATTATTLKG